jgi:hypothetical protein
VLKSQVAYFYSGTLAQFCSGVDSLTVGLSNMINRFHATFQTDVDEATLREIEEGTPDGMSCPIRLPNRPGTK